MKTLTFLLKKEFLQVFRNKFLLRLIFIMPVMQLAILPWAATFDQKDISLCVVDNDKSTFSTQLMEKVLSTGFFKLSDYSATYDAALEKVEYGNSDLILEIPRDFEKKFSVNFNVRDLFDSRKFRSVTSGEGFYQYSENKRMGRMFGLTLTYNFGNTKPKPVDRPKPSESEESDEMDME